MRPIFNAIRNIKDLIFSVIGKTLTESKLIGHAANPHYTSPANFYNHRSKSFKRNKRKGL